MSAASELKVLDKGFVRLESFSGGDEAVLRAARVSYGKSPEPDAVRDAKLICYLMANDHGTPFEQTSFTFHVKAPILVFRQWHRTRVGVSYNELSARYTEMKDEFYIPEKWRAQEKGPKSNKQGSVSTDELPHLDLTYIAQSSCERSMVDYRRLLGMGAAREMARMVLPVSLYSEMYFTCNARSLMFFIRLRSDLHAQNETRQYSHAMAFLFREAMPTTFRAMCEEMEKDEQVVFEGTKPKRNYDEFRKALGLVKIHKIKLVEATK